MFMKLLTLRHSFQTYLANKCG